MSDTTETVKTAAETWTEIENMYVALEKKLLETTSQSNELRIAIKWLNESKSWVARIYNHN